MLGHFAHLRLSSSIQIIFWGWDSVNLWLITGPGWMGFRYHLINSVCGFIRFTMCTGKKQEDSRCVVSQQEPDKIIFQTQQSLSVLYLLYKLRVWYVNTEFYTENYPWISGSIYSALQPILKSKPGKKLILVLFLIWETPSPPKEVEIFHFQPSAFNWKLCPIPTWS